MRAVGLDGPTMAMAGALAIGAGLSWYAAHPPARWWATVLLVVPLALGAVHQARRLGRGGPALAGAVVGLVAFAPMLAWIVNPAGVVGWVLLVLVQAAWVALWGWVVAPWVADRWIVVVGPLAWIAMEVARSSVPLGGFGWGELAYAHVDGSWMLPLARIAGGRSLTLVTALVGALAFEVVRRAVADTAGVEGPRRDRILAALPHAQRPALALAGVTLLTVLATVEPPAQTGTMDVLVAQGNDEVEPVLRGAEEDRRILQVLADVTVAAVGDETPPDLTVWPESSLDRDPFTPRGEDLAAILREVQPELSDGALLAGVNLEGPRAGTYYNAAVLFDPVEVTDAYVKRRLVPFGEFVPARPLLGDLPPLRQVPRDAVAGQRPQVLQVAGTPVAVLICFETLFPSLARSNIMAGERPAELLVASTNDASFGVSAEPAQHLAQSRLRAVETGRWVVHAALSGSSAFVDPWGGVHDATALFSATSIRREVPLVAGSTPFLVMGDVVSLPAVLAGLVLLLLRLRRTVRGRSDRQERA